MAFWKLGCMGPFNNDVAAVHGHVAVWRFEATKVKKTKKKRKCRTQIFLCKMSFGCVFEQWNGFALLSFVILRYPRTNFSSQGQIIQHWHKWSPWTPTVARALYTVLYTFYYESFILISHRETDFLWLVLWSDTSSFKVFYRFRSGCFVCRCFAGTQQTGRPRHISTWIAHC